MNLLQKQGFFNSIILYAGTALGFFNLIILFPRYLTVEELGFYSLLIAISGLFAQLASAGISNVILRYFPYYRTENKGHNGFVTFVCLFVLLSFAVFTILFFVLKTPVLNYYRHKDGAFLLVRYYYIIIPVAFFTLAYTVIESLARAVFKNVLSAFLKEVLLRIFTSIGILLIVIKLTDYHGFIQIYVIANFIIALILGWSVYLGEDFRLTSISAEVKTNSKEMINYGFFAVLSGSSFALIQNLDMIMLSAMTDKSFALVGIYTVFFGIAMVINLPAKALNRTSYQIISNAWKDNDLAKIGKIYHKTSVIQFLVGCLLLVGLIINKPHILELLHKSAYDQYFNVFIVVGIAFLVDITGGLNSHIISSSTSYKLVTYLLVAAVVFCVGLNYFLIPRLGMMGAALAYLATMFTLNFVYWLFIKVKFKLQPFDKTYIYVAAIALVCLLIGLYLPVISGFLFDLIYRSGIVALIYIFLTYLFKILEDINLIFDKLLFVKK